MQHVNSIVCQIRSIVPKTRLWLLLFACMIGMELLYGASSLSAAGRYLPKRYALRGDITLTYEKKWVEQTASDADSERFTHNYSLGLSGYIVDPRLMTFDIDGTLSEEKNYPGDTLNSHGVNAALNLLNKPARRGFFSRFPQPIILTLGYLNADFTDINSYGISFGYDVFERMRIHRQFQQQQQQQQFRRQQQIMQQINENNAQQNQVTVQGQNNAKLKPVTLPLPLPVMYVDYNNYRYSFNDPSNNFNIDSEFLNIRLVDRSNKTEYHSEYNYHRTEGVAKSETQHLNTEVNYRDYWEQKEERFESYNSLDLSDVDTRRALELSSNNVWSKRLGKDLKDDLLFSGGGSYFKSDNEASPENYQLEARSEYTKKFSKVWNRSNVELNYGDSGLDELYLVRYHNETNYDISRRLALNGRGHIGRNELGEQYGAGVGLQVWTLISITPRYDYSRSAASEGSTTNHYFNLDMQGRISRDLTFNSRNNYRIEQVSGRSPFKERTLDMRHDFFWTLPFMNINLGVSRLETKKSEREGSRALNGVAVSFQENEVDLAVTSVYSNLTAELSRSIFLTFKTSFTKDQTQETFVANPIITWNLRQVMITAEYEFSKTYGETEAADHRIFFRLTRSFAKRLRNL